MEFTKLEMSAIVKLAKVMVMADGRVDEKEMKLMTNELLRFGVPINDVSSLLDLGDNMEYSDAIKIISAMSDYEKKYVTAYLGVMIAIDGDIDESETKMWSLISVLCELPTMSINDAVTFMKNL